MKIELVDYWKKWLHLHSVQWNLAGVGVGALLASVANTASIVYSIKGLGIVGTLSVRWMILTIVAFPLISSGVRIVKQKVTTPVPSTGDAPSITITADKGDGK